MQLLSHQYRKWSRADLVLLRDLAVVAKILPTELSYDVRVLQFQFVVHRVRSKRCSFAFFLAKHRQVPEASTALKKAGK